MMSEIKVLREMRAQRIPYAEISKVLNRTVRALRTIAKRHGITKPYWSAAQTQYLLENWTTTRTCVLARVIGKSQACLHMKARRMNLPKRRQFNHD